MTVWSFRAHMPIALHPNSYLDVIFEHNQLGERSGENTLFGFELESASKGIGSIPLFAHTDDKIKYNPDGKLMRYPIRWRNPKHRVVLNRNTTLWVSRKQKKENLGMGGIVRYKQPKRGVAAQMFDYNKQLFLMKRASEKDLPHGFDFQMQYDMAINNLNSEVIGGDESNVNNNQGDIPFPTLRYFKISFQIKDSANNSENWTKGWYNMDLQSIVDKLKKSKDVDPANELEGVQEELESLVALMPISNKRKYPFEVSALLKHHRFAY